MPQEPHEDLEMVVEEEPFDYNQALYKNHFMLWTLAIACFEQNKVLQVL